MHVPPPKRRTSLNSKRQLTARTLFLLLPNFFFAVISLYWSPSIALSLTHPLSNTLRTLELSGDGRGERANARGLTDPSFPHRLLTSYSFNLLPSGHHHHTHPPVPDTYLYIYIYIPFALYPPTFPSKSTISLQQQSPRALYSSYITIPVIFPSTHSIHPFIHQPISFRLIRIFSLCCPLLRPL